MVKSIMIVSEQGRMPWTSPLIPITLWGIYFIASGAFVSIHASSIAQLHYNVKLSCAKIFRFG